MAEAWRLVLRLFAVAALAVAAMPASANVITVRLISDIASTNPGVRRDEYTDGVLMHIVEGLVAYREDGSVGPLLAEGWQVSPDGRSYTFRLRAGLRFHNGAPVTSREVLWSLRRYLAPETRWRCRRDLTQGQMQIVGLTAVGRDGVRITLASAAPGFLATLARIDCGGTAILHPSSVGADGSWRTPVGTGPYCLSDWRHGQWVELVRFPLYRSRPGPRDGNTGGKHALAERIRFVVVPDIGAAQSALLRGDIDVLDNVMPLDALVLKRDPAVRVTLAHGMDMFALLLQTRDPLLRDVRIRQAIALTIDVPGLVRALSEGASQPNRSIVPVASRNHRGIHDQIPAVNLARARALLKAAGYRGQPIPLVSNRRVGDLYDTAILIQAMARKAGIDFRIETLDWPAQLARFASGNFRAMVMGYSARLDPALNYESFVGDRAIDARKVWDDPAARTLLAQARGTADPTARQAIFDRLQAMFLRDVPAVILFNQGHITAVRANVVGFRGWAATTLRLWDVAKR